MKGLSRFLSLPAALLPLTIFKCASAEELQWPYNLPRTLKYYPEDEAHVKRELAAQDRLLWETPTAVQKMGDDPNEKFYLRYWQFEAMATEQEKDNRLLRPAGCAETIQYANQSTTCVALAPLAPHTNRGSSPYSGLLGRRVISRDFQCPADTVSCASIGSDLCCQSSETCVNTSDGVGCCPAGATCGSDTVAGCDTDSGYTSCPNSDNGGCCLPGAACLDSGCAFYGTQTVSVTLPTVTITSGGTVNPTSMTQGSPVPGSTVIVTSAYTQTVSQEGSTVTQTVTAAVTVTVQPSCADGFFSCPATLGGGCCPQGQGCATDQKCPDLTTPTTVIAVPPVRPTTSAPGPDTSVTVADTNIPVSTQPTAGACPPYYYMCEARYLGGCCRVDRNCDTTSCPPTSTSDIVTNGVTIGVAQAPTGQCMTSYQSCSAAVGGGCCPPGYACGTQCVAADGTQTAVKEAPTGNGAAIGVKRVSWILLATAFGLTTERLWL